tara:strand:+ start:1677 stop:2144 length:468 start_codon:yes stop_codon:yes gene_type:complete
MKRIVYLASVAALIGFSSCGNEEKAPAGDVPISTDIINIPSESDDNTPLASFDFDDIVYEFGEITQGEKVQTTFKFTNTGDVDLIISDAKGSCGCTVPVYPRNPIAPGEEGEIEVVFDSNGKMGQQNKTVTLIANTKPNTTVLAIKGNVLTPETK